MRTAGRTAARLWGAMFACGLLGVACAACGGGGATSGSSASHDTTPGGQATVLYVNFTNVGRVVTLPYGDPVYIDVDEHTGSAPACTGACADQWVPVTTGAAPKGASGIQESGLGTAKYDGKKQVTYFGHRLYYFASDHHPLTASGQGDASTWFVILPTGQPLMSP